MADDYTPKTEEVCDEYATREAPSRDHARGLAFYRWLAAHDAALRAEWEAEQDTEEPDWETERVEQARIDLGALITEARDGDFEDRDWMIDVIDRLADALEAAEQAHTSTDDRRIVNLRRVLETDYNGTTGREWIEGGLGGPLAKDILAIIEAPARRTAVQEPSATPQHDDSCGERCNHCQVCGEGIRYGSRCPEHYLNQPQGEPTDAQVHAAADAIARARGYVQGACLDEHYRDARAALTAAYETKGEGR